MNASDSSTLFSGSTLCNFRALHTHTHMRCHTHPHHKASVMKEWTEKMIKKKHLFALLSKRSTKRHIIFEDMNLLLSKVFAGKDRYLILFTGRQKVGMGSNDGKKNPFWGQTWSLKNQLIFRLFARGRPFLTFPFELEAMCRAGPNNLPLRKAEQLTVQCTTDRRPFQCVCKC